MKRLFASLAIVALAWPIGAEERRIFHNETVAGLASSRRTHVRVTGTVTLVRHEADGDTHIRLADDAGHFIVAEIVPYHVLPAPRLGQVITVDGIRRFDNENGHGWAEVHPVEAWTASR